MQYELKKVELFGTPEFNQDLTEVTLTLSITTGIIGDIYYFEKVDNNIPITLSTSLTALQILNACNTFGANWVVTNYPNT